MSGVVEKSTAGRQDGVNRLKFLLNQPLPSPLYKILLWAGKSFRLITEFSSGPGALLTAILFVKNNPEFTGGKIMNRFRI
ncbi:MAG: hypothetical protein K6T80_01210 [Firmicutes bacterium]|nr:hypothetical protein [Bacillota bacterium]